MKFGKIKKSCSKFDWNLKFLSALVLQNIGKIWQNQEIWVTLEILLKFEIFDHPGHAKHEIWQNQEMWVTLKIFLKF